MYHRPHHKKTRLSGFFIGYLVGFETPKFFELF